MKLLIQKRNAVGNQLAEAEVANIEEILSRLNNQFIRDIQADDDEEEEEFEIEEPMDFHKKEIEMEDIVVSENGDEYIIELIVPGFQKEDFIIEVSEDGILSVNAENEYDADVEDRPKRFFGVNNNSFDRFFQLPEDADSEEILGVYKNGILTLFVAKKSNVESDGDLIEIQ